MTTRTLTFAFAAALTFGVAARSEAASITFSNETFDGGSGWGNVLAIMGLQNTPSEAGEVAWDGSANVITGNATNQSTTLTVAQLAAEGIVAADTDFGLVFNLNDTDRAPDVDLTALEMRFYDADGLMMFAAPYVCAACSYPLPIHLTEVGQGVGNSGFLFRVGLDASQKTAFFGTSTNRVGLYAAVSNSDNGPEGFYLADLHTQTIPNDPIDPPTHMPEPGSMILLGTGIAVVAFRRYRAR